MKRTLVYIVLILLSFSCRGQEKEYKNYKTSLSELFILQKINTGEISVLIDKSDYKLSILSNSVIVKEYPVVFGGNAKDDKLMQGDDCTPEGTFYIISKYPHKSWSKFIWIDYPNNDSWKKHNKAKQDGIIPENADIGGEIGIHGVPKGMNKLIDLKSNWTLGCISLKNDDVNEIYPYITKNTDIIIRK
ncbi:MAG: L,D-transpeptidase [Bacteroidales bacterium]|nr:L,D-transpeptidase [Bacteroidales bacterium]